VERDGIVRDYFKRYYQNDGSRLNPKVLLYSLNATFGCPDCYGIDMRKKGSYFKSGLRKLLKKETFVPLAVEVYANCKRKET
jgi:hypothetical protein